MWLQGKGGSAISFHTAIACSDKPAPLNHSSLAVLLLSPAGAQTGPPRSNRHMCWHFLCIAASRATTGTRRWCLSSALDDLPTSLLCCTAAHAVPSCRGHAGAEVPKQPNGEVMVQRDGTLLPPSLAFSFGTAQCAAALPSLLLCRSAALPACTRSFQAWCLLAVIAHLACSVPCSFNLSSPKRSSIAAQYGAHWDDLDLDENPAGLGGGSVRVATVMLYLSGELAAAVATQVLRWCPSAGTSACLVPPAHLPPNLTHLLPKSWNLAPLERTG